MSPTKLMASYSPAQEIICLISIFQDSVTYLLDDGSIQAVGTLEDVKAKVGGEFVEISPEAYELAYAAWSAKFGQMAVNAQADEAVPTPADVSEQASPQAQDQGQDSPAAEGGQVDESNPVGETQEFDGHAEGQASAAA